VPPQLGLDAGHPTTRQGFPAGCAHMRATFPDLAIEPIKMFAEDDKVSVVLRISGTHHGEFMGNKASGRALEIEGVDILRAQDGKLREHWGVMGAGKMPAQLRLSPGE
jgi:predicted ester cyclase